MSLLLQLLLLICVLGAVSAGSIVEPQTKHVFSENDSGLSLAGVGVRVKQIGPIKAKVYAAGFYVDKNSVKSACSGSTCKTSSELAASSSFNNAVTDPKNKNIILKMARTVGAETMVAALADSVKPAMGGKDTTKLKEFEGILLKSLKDTGAKNGMVFKFKSSSGKMTVTIDDKKAGEINSPTLCSAFVSIYSGKKTVSPALKADITKNVFSWISNKQ